MTTHTEDFRVIAARTHLEHARKPDELPLIILIREAIELRRLMGWLLEVADDYAATALDQSVTQVIDDGGVYLAPADVHGLCPACLSRAIEVIRATAPSNQAP